MALTKCPDCFTKVSRSAKACPDCGADIPAFLERRRLYLNAEKIAECEEDTKAPRGVDHRERGAERKPERDQTAIAMWLAVLLAFGSGLMSAGFSLLYILIAHGSSAPVHEWPPAIVGGFISVVGILVGAFVVVVVRTGRGVAAHAIMAKLGIVTSGLALMFGFTIAGTLTVLQYYNIGGWGEDHRAAIAEKKALAKVSSQRAALAVARESHDYLRAEQLARVMVEAEPNNPKLRNTQIIVFVEKQHFVASQLIENGKFDEAEEELLKARTALNNASTDVSASVRLIEKEMVRLRTARQTAAFEARKVDDAKRKRAQTGVFEMLDVIGQSKAVVSRVLGPPSSCMKIPEGYPKCYYHGRRIEIVYGNNRAEWIKARPADDGTFHGSFVGAAYGPSMGEPTFENRYLIRWANRQGFSSVQMFRKGEQIDYIHWCRKRCL